MCGSRRICLTTSENEPRLAVGGKSAYSGAAFNNDHHTNAGHPRAAFLRVLWERGSRLLGREKPPKEQALIYLPISSNSLQWRKRQITTWNHWDKWQHLDTVSVLDSCVVSTLNFLDS